MESQGRGGFSGRGNKLDDKLKWYHSSTTPSGMISCRAHQSQQEFLPAVLLDACDDSVELQLIIKRSQASLLNKIEAVVEGQIHGIGRARPRRTAAPARLEQGAFYGEGSCSMSSNGSRMNGPLVVSCAQRLRRNLSRCFTPTSAASRSTTWSSRRQLSPRRLRGPRHQGLMRTPDCTEGRRAGYHVGLVDHRPQRGRTAWKSRRASFLCDKRGKCCVALELRIDAARRSRRSRTNEVSRGRECSRAGARGQDGPDDGRRPQGQGGQVRTGKAKRSGQTRIPPTSPRTSPATT